MAASTIPTPPGSDPVAEATPPPTLAPDEVFTQSTGEVVWGVVDPLIVIPRMIEANYEPWAILKHFAPDESQDVIIVEGLEGVDNVVMEIANLLLKVRGGRR